MIWIEHRGIIPERTEDCPNGEFGALVIAKDCNINCPHCFNQHLKKGPIYEDTPEMIIAKIKRNPLHQWCVLGGLEWSLDPYGLVFIAEEALRNDLKVIIYTGKELDEFSAYMLPIGMKHLKGCWLKYGPYKECLKGDNIKYGIHLASVNQNIILL